MPEEFPCDVFLSHSAKDKRSKPPTLMHDTGGNAVVRDVAERLKKDGLQKASQLSTLTSQLPTGSDWAQWESSSLHSPTATLSELENKIPLSMGR